MAPAAGLRPAEGPKAAVPTWATSPYGRWSASFPVLRISGAGDFFQEPRGHTRFRKIGAIAAAVDGAGEDELVHGARHADITEAALLFNVFRDEHGARVRKESFFEAAKEDQRELQALGGMEAHERDLGALVVVVGVADEGGVVEELVESFAAVARVHGRINQFAQVFDAGEGFGRVFFFEELDVAGAVDQEFQQVGCVHHGSGEFSGHCADLGLGGPSCIGGVGRRAIGGGASYIGVGLGRAGFRGAEIEGEVSEFGGIEGGGIVIGSVGGVPEGTRCLGWVYPGLTSGANEWRPFGTRVRRLFESYLTAGSRGRGRPRHMIRACCALGELIGETACQHGAAVFD